MVKISEHFDDAEFKCKCGKCEGLPISDALVDLLEDMRAHFGGKPIHINSGYRCPAHNASVGGAAHSQHLLGTAADVVVEGISPAVVYAWADAVNENGGVGRYITFTHVDVRGHLSRW